jgi:hypothetical protein
LDVPPELADGDILDDVPYSIKQAIKLYNRCTMFKNDLALPASGGVLDQNETVVRILEVIHEEVQIWRKQKQTDDEFMSTQRSRVMRNQIKSTNVRRRS